MLNIPEAVKNLYKEETTESIRKNLRITFPDGQLSDDFPNGITCANIVAESMRFTESVCSQDNFKFGTSEAPVIEFETVGVPNILGYRIQAWLEIETTTISDDLTGDYDGEFIALADSDLGFPFYRLPLGVFVVKSCPRSHGNMQHRQITAYGATIGANSALDSMTAFEWWKFTRQYHGSVFNYSANLIYESMFTAQTIGDNFRASIPAPIDDGELTTRETAAITSDKIYYDQSATIQRRRLYISGNSYNVHYAMRTFEGSYIDYTLKDALVLVRTSSHELENVHRTFKTRALTALNSALSARGLAYTDLYLYDAATGEREYFESEDAVLEYYWSNLLTKVMQNGVITIKVLDAAQTQPALPAGTSFEFDRVQGFLFWSGVNENYYLDVAMWESFGTLSFQADSGDPVTISQGEMMSTAYLRTLTPLYPISRLSAGLPFRIPSTLKVERATSYYIYYYYSYTNAISIRELFAAHTELSGGWCKTSRDGSLTLAMPDTGETPYTYDRGIIQELWYGDDTIKPIGSIQYTYTDSDNETQTAIYTNDENPSGSMYVMDSNYLLMHAKATPDAERLFDIFFDDVAETEFPPMDAVTRGLPFIEAGDIGVFPTDESGGTITCNILRRELSGIQTLTDTIACVSGEIMEIS